MSPGKQKRAMNDLMEDCLWPGGIGCQPGRDKRDTALCDVLCTMPDRDYRALADKPDTFDWFVPAYDLGACTYPFHATVFPEKEGNRRPRPYARVIYLSPRLEHELLAIVIATVAHELAHVLLEHSLEPEADQASVQEDEAWQRVRDWGFKSEVRQYEAQCKREEEFWASRCPGITRGNEGAIRTRGKCRVATVTAGGLTERRSNRPRYKGEQ